MRELHQQQRNAQTALELTIFGAVLIFVIGLMVRQALNANLQQGSTLKAARMALSESFRASFPASGDSNASRNAGSILFIEDRKSPEVNKYGTLNRTPYINSSAGSFSRNLFYPIDYGENESLPIMDLYINGKHFTFTTAGFRQYNIAGKFAVYSIVPNLPDSDDYNISCSQCFDLDRNGSVDVPASRRANFAWQWKALATHAGEINPATGKNTVADVDDDLKEESILEMVDINGRRYGPEGGPDGETKIQTVFVLDQQAGDIDFTYNSRNARQGRRRPGLRDDQKVYSFIMDGTELVLNQGTSTQSVNQVEVVERQVQLSNNTGRMCNGTNPDVEVCGNCFSNANIYRTCFDPGSLVLYVRSRFRDTRSSTWTTDISN